MRVVYYVAASLDGYIAGPSGSVEWLDRLAIDGDDTGYERFFEGVDALLMGRNTYDFVCEHGSWPYADKPTWVCTHRDLQLIPACNLQEERDAGEAVVAARNRGVGTLWVVGGGALAGTLMRLGLMTHLHVSVMPAVMGDGIRLVDSLPEPVFLVQERCRPCSGFVGVEYRIAAGPADRRS